MITHNRTDAPDPRPGNYYVSVIVRKNTGKTPDDMREFMAQEALDYRNGGVVALDQFRYYE